MGAHVAMLIAAQVIAKPNCVLGFATGSTPLPAYRELIRQNAAGYVDFSAVKTVNLDEYVGLSRDNEQSYHYFMHENLFNHINIGRHNTNLPDGMAADTGAECARYDELIASLGGIDLQLLGLGHNGHIGFNEPSAAFSTGTHCVGLDKKTIEANKRFFASADEVPRRALTMGMREIMGARRIVLAVAGKDKADILRAVLRGSVTPAVPGSILQLHPDLVVVCDAAAHGGAL